MSSRPPISLSSSLSLSPNISPSMLAIRLLDLLDRALGLVLDLVLGPLDLLDLLDLLGRLLDLLLDRLLLPYLVPLLEPPLATTDPSRPSRLSRSPMCPNRPSPVSRENLASQASRGNPANPANQARCLDMDREALNRRRIPTTLPLQWEPRLLARLLLDTWQTTTIIPVLPNHRRRCPPRMACQTNPTSRTTNCTRNRRLCIPTRL